jgi:hypothetical protein
VKPAGSNTIRSDRPPQKQHDRHRTGDDSRFQGDRCCSKLEACSFEGDRCCFRLETLSSELQCSKFFSDYSNSELQSCPLKSELSRFEGDRCCFNPQVPRMGGDPCGICKAARVSQTLFRVVRSIAPANLLQQSMVLFKHLLMSEPRLSAKQKEAIGGLT